MSRDGHICVDLDRTLAYYTFGQSGIAKIGEPIPVMMQRIKEWLAEGIEVRIFTARACRPELIPPIKEWLKEQGLPDLKVTNAKDFDTVEIWDDLAVRVIPNTGQPCCHR